MRLSVLIFVVCSAVIAHAEPVPLPVGHTLRLELTPEVPLFVVIRARGEEGVEQFVMLAPPGADDTHRYKPATLTIVALKQPRRVTVTVRERNGGFEVTGADVRRYVVPDALETFTVDVVRPDVVRVMRILGSGCPANVVTTAWLLGKKGLVPLLTTEFTGETTWSEGTLTHWGGDAGSPTHQLGFPSREFAVGTPAARQVIAINEVIADDALVCSTRRRYRLVGESLQLIDTTDAPDGGCLAP